MHIPLSRQLFALVDDADADLVVSAAPWYAFQSDRSRIFYARTDLLLPGGVRIRPYLHTYITGWSLVDHANGDGLDNRRINLRQASRSQNGANRGLPSNNRSGYKGVSRTPYGRWKAQIRVDGRDRYLGVFRTPEDAARAYDAECLSAFGEFARPNFGTRGPS